MNRAESAGSRTGRHGGSAIVRGHGDLHFRDSDIGQQFREALTAAARRGVRVRLLVDRFGSYQLPRDYFGGLVAAGGAMRWFNELRLSSFSFRDHRKLLIVDGRVAFVGGCNIAPEYSGDGITTGWRDGGVSVQGGVAGLLDTVDRQWKRAVAQRWKFPTGGFSQRVRGQCGTEVQALFIKPGLGRNPLRQALRQDLATAKDVCITSAYFLPSTDCGNNSHRRWPAERGYACCWPGKAIPPLMQMASRSLYRRLVNQGIEIWEYQPQVLHAKSVVVDDIVFVGSSNLDPRSLRINFEIMLRIQDPALAATAQGRRSRFGTARDPHHPGEFEAWPLLVATAHPAFCLLAVCPARLRTGGTQITGVAPP